MSEHIFLMSCLNRFRSVLKKIQFLCHFMAIFGMQIFLTSNSINCQINGNFEPLKGFGINFLGSYHPLIYLYISLIMINKGETTRNPQKTLFNSWQASAKLSPPSPSPSEFCTDEDNSVNRSAMDALRYSKN